ncbi:MAG: hypothetical protein F6K16_32010, partial [Symploca sp. SIO2B6]|nr:hypothetical protein [Symploca sp. SIO2B6]
SHPQFTSQEDIHGQINQSVQAELTCLQGLLALTDEDVALVEAEILAAQTTHQQRLLHYQHHFAQVLANGISLSPLVREEFDHLRQRLNLTNDDVERVEWQVRQKPPSLSLHGPTVISSSSTPSSSPPPSLPTPISPTFPASPSTTSSLQAKPMADSAYSSSGSSSDPSPDPIVPDASLSASSSSNASHLSNNLNSSNPPDSSNSPEQAQPEVLAQYELAFRAAIAHQVPIRERDRQILENLQRTLNLSDHQIRQISQAIKTEVEQDARHYQTKIRQYERQFASLAKDDGQLSSAERAILKDLQTQLELNDTDVQTLEHQIIAQRLAKSAAATSPDSPPQSDTNPHATTAASESVSPANMESTPGENSQIAVPPDQPVTPVFEVDSTPSPPASTLPDPAPSFEVIQTSPASENDASMGGQGTEPSPPSSAPLADTVLETQVLNQQANLKEEEERQIEPQEAVGKAIASATSSSELTTEGKPEDGPEVKQESRPLPIPDLTLEYSQLKTLLENQEWQKADEETFAIMKKATAGLVSWMDPQAIRELPCYDLTTLDDLWYHYSDGKFGFRVQHQIFEETQVNSNRITRFGKAVGWTLFRRQFVGFKYYKQLTFDLKEAPPGHLPAKWFWELPLWESIRSGGLGTGRGGCGDDAAGMLFAMMYQFVRCGGGSR